MKYLRKSQLIREKSCPSKACPTVFGASEPCSSHSFPMSSLSAVTPLSFIAEVNSMASQSLRQLSAHSSTLSSTYRAVTTPIEFEQGVVILGQVCGKFSPTSKTVIASDFTYHILGEEGFEEPGDAITLRPCPFPCAL